MPVPCGFADEWLEEGGVEEVGRADAGALVVR